jgi:hypothetical protein
MRNDTGARPRRMLWHLIEDAITIYRQDASEYAFAGLIGAFAACMSTLVLLMAGGAIGSMLAVLLLAIITITTLATVTEALRRVTDQLEPSTADAFAVVLRGLPAILLPWAIPTVAVSLAVLLEAEFGHVLPSIARAAIELSIAAGALSAALNRVQAVPSLVVRRSTPAAALREARSIVAHHRSRIAGAWAVCLAPTALLFLVAALNGFGAVSSAVAALAFAGSMSFAAIVNSLLFFDAASESETTTRRGAASVAAVRTMRQAR